MGVCLVGIDAICMILLAVAALKWEGNAKEEKANKAVMIMQVLALVGEKVPHSSRNALEFDSRLVS